MIEVKTQIEQKIAFAGIKMLIKRVRSKSPAWAIRIQWFAGVLAAACALGIAVINLGFLSFVPAAELAEALKYLHLIGIGLTGSGLVAALPSTDPNLVSQELKDAILNQAVTEGTHVAVNAEATKN